MIFEGTQVLNTMRKGIPHPKKHPIILFRIFFGTFKIFFGCFRIFFGFLSDDFGCFQDNFWFRSFSDLFWMFSGLFWIFFGFFWILFGCFRIFLGCLEHPYHPKFKLMQATSLKRDSLLSGKDVKGKRNTGFSINLLKY